MHTKLKITAQILIYIFFVTIAIDPELVPWAYVWLVSIPAVYVTWHYIQDRRLESRDFVAFIAKRDAYYWKLRRTWSARDFLSIKSRRD